VGGRERQRETEKDSQIAREREKETEVGRPIIILMYIKKKMNNTLTPERKGPCVRAHTHTD
jgi:hypothetical protein